MNGSDPAPPPVPAHPLAARIANDFTYHRPKDGQQKKYEEIRGKARELATLFLDLTPLSREQSLALTALEESVMWANASIARNT